MKLRKFHLKRNTVFFVIVFMVGVLSVNAQQTLGLDSRIIVENKTSKSDFPIVSSKGQATLIKYDVDEFPGVIRALASLKNDIEKVTESKPKVKSNEEDDDVEIIVGTIGKNKDIDRLIASKKIDVSTIEGKWESFMITTISNPKKGVKSALLIVGSDKRGTIYGIYELSRQLGVSPWYWWADVPVKKYSSAYVLSGNYVSGEPKVKYRGIFLNDEEPALGSWAREQFGGFNHQFYEHVFELILRLRGNYLWPAMWGSAFYDDDAENGRLADEMGIVMGTSHHEPLAKAHKEWRKYGTGEWNFGTNSENLNAFWKSGMERTKDWEALITIGMRGDGDEAMTEGTAIDLLENIVANQREIIKEVTGKSPEQTPQMWALYKEVQDYYDKGMNVPDDVTLLFCDDNWGNLRKLPELDAKPREGGYGIYYHYDYVGGPRSYRWINTNQIERTWEQMNLAYEYSVDKIWIVNVGDLKPMEFPISFWFDMAWNPQRFTPDNLSDYYQEWVTEQFGGQYVDEISELLKKYTKFNARIKPELLDANTYSLEPFGEWNTVVSDYKDIENKSKQIAQKIEKSYSDAYYQLIEHPIEASANLYEMYYYTALNHYYAQQNNGLANKYAEYVKANFINDSIITAKYHQLNNGKWNHFMSQIHIGYTSWNNPRMQIMPKVLMVDEAECVDSSQTNFSYSSPKNDNIPKNAKGFIEQQGFISIEAEHFSSKTEVDGVTWAVVDNLGKTGDAVISLPVSKGRVPLSASSSKLSYNIFLKSTGKMKVHCYFSPTINYTNRTGFYYGLSVDDESPVQVNYDNSPVIFNYNGKVTKDWHGNVWNNIKVVSTELEINEQGNHTLNYFRVDEGLVLQKIVIEFDMQNDKTFLGSPESFCVE